MAGKEEKRSRILGSIAAGRAFGGRVQVPGFRNQPARRGELLAQLEEAEAKLAGRPGLWVRAFVATSLRALNRELSELSEPSFAELRARVHELGRTLRAIDDQELGPLRARLEEGSFRPADLLAELAARPRYEWDAFSERLLDIHEVPGQEVERGAEMVHYLASPLTAILEIADELSPDDVFFDLGAGLGKVTMLCAWLSGARTIGVELEPAYVRIADDRIRRFGFRGAEMIREDARQVDYRDSTAVYFFDPFRGEILSSVLDRLRPVAAKPEFRIYARGDTTRALKELDWLSETRVSANEVSVFKAC